MGLLWGDHVDFQQVINLSLAGLAGGIGALIGGWIMWHWAGPGIILNALKNHLGKEMVLFLLNPTMKTGKKVKDEDGKEHDQIVSPMIFLGREAGKQAFFELKGLMGIDERKKQVLLDDMRTALSDPNNPLAQQMAAINPKVLDRALEDSDYLRAAVEIFKPQLQTIGKKALDNFINKRQGNNATAATVTEQQGTQGLKDWWK